MFNNRTRLWQVLIVTISTSTYMASYLLRKPVGIVKTDLETTYHLTKNNLGWLDSSFFLPYAMIQIFYSNSGDKFGSRITIALNLLVPGIAMISFGFWSSPIILSILFFITGFAQATHWPNCTRCVSQWFPPSELDTVFGIVGSLCYVGGILGTSLAVYLQSRYAPDLRLIFMLPSLINIGMSVVVWFLLKTPQEAGIEIDTEEECKLEEAKPTSTEVLSFSESWNIPIVKELAYTMFGIKLVRYTFYMWLPMYLHQKLQYTKENAGYLSNTFELGGIVGCTVLSVSIVKYLKGKTHWGVFCTMIGGAISLSLFQLTSSWGAFYNIFFMFFVGILQGGPDILVTSTLAVEVGKKANAQAAVSGILNGFGSLGTTAQGPVIAFIVTYFGWSGSFYFMIIVALCSAFFVGKAAMMHDRAVSSQVVGENHSS